MCPRRGTPSVQSRRHEGGDRVQTFVVVRRGAWKTQGDVRAARHRAARDLERFEEVARWMRSYEVEESDGAIGSVCLYQAVTPEAIRSTRPRPPSLLTRS